MGSQKKIKIDKELYERAEQFAEKDGYSSVEEFVSHLLEKYMAETADGDSSIEKIEERLKGLGYIS